MSVSKEELVRNYTKAIREGNAAVFAGAGLSSSSGLVNWKELLRPLAKDINLDVDKEEHDLLSVAQFYKDQRSTRSGINQKIMEAFSKNVEPNENIRVLARLPIFTYWTTNYDKLLEDGIKEANRNPDVKIQSSQLSNSKPDRDCVVFKMHGDVDFPENAVLTREDYETYGNKRSLFRTALQGDLISKEFLFIGFSFEDPNLAYILAQIHSLLDDNVRDHYCFFKRVQRDDYPDDGEFKYDLAKQEMKVENLTHYGIQTVYVDDYSEITDILHEIEKASKLKNVFISGSASAYQAPWTKDSAEELAGKLSGALVHGNCRITSGFGLGIGSAVINGALNVIYADKYRHVDEHLCLRPFPQNVTGAERTAIYKKYREDMLSEAGIAIFIFGNKKDSSGNIITAPGCLDEYHIAKAEGNCIIPIGSTGYAAKDIYDEVKTEMVVDPDAYPYLKGYIDDLGSVTDIDKLVRIVVEIVRKISEL